MDNDLSDIDEIWLSSRTARQIYALGEVDNDIAKLLSIAASCVSLLTLPQTDNPDDKLPTGEERTERFALEVTEYFTLLDSIQMSIRSSLAHIRNSRIAPSAVNASSQNFVPPSLGVSLPTENGQVGRESQGLQGERLARDAWIDILQALQRLKASQAR